MTYHPQGGAGSSQWFHRDDWLDFNMFQSGHSRANIPNDETTAANYRLEPPKPVLDGEPRYEDHPIDWKPANGWFDDADVRQAAWWSMLAGACGHTYGNHNIWQMWQPDRQPISSARTPWPEAVKHPGSAQMGVMRRFFEVPRLAEAGARSVALDRRHRYRPRAPPRRRANDGSFAVIYTPYGRPVQAKLDKLGGEVQAQWFDPRTGATLRGGTERKRLRSTRRTRPRERLGAGGRGAAPQ